jgi:hypothetical protein
MGSRQYWILAIIFGFIIGFLIQPCSCTHVEPKSYAGLYSLPDRYLDLFPPLKRAVRANTPVPRGTWNNMIRTFVVSLHQAGIQDPALVDLYDDLLRDPGADELTRQALRVMIRGMIRESRLQTRPDPDSHQ